MNPEEEKLDPKIFQLPMSVTVGSSASISKNLAKLLSAKIELIAVLDTLRERLKPIPHWIQDHPRLTAIGLVGVFGGYWVEKYLVKVLPPQLGWGAGYAASILWGLFVLWVGQQIGRAIITKS